MLIPNVEVTTKWDSKKSKVLGEGKVSKIYTGVSIGLTKV